jgi:hypothetical protein
MTVITVSRNELTRLRVLIDISDRRLRVERFYRDRHIVCYDHRSRRAIPGVVVEELGAVTSSDRLRLVEDGWGSHGTLAPVEASGFSGVKVRRDQPLCHPS